MISMKKKRALRSALAITICTVTIASVSTPVYSAPSTDELENTTSDLKGELNDLNSQLSSLSKELDTASSQVEDLAAKVEKSKLDLASAQLDEEAQYDSMKDRIKFMYEGGGASLVQILLTSENMGDFLNKAEYVATISKYDRSMLEELQQVRANVEKKQKDLEEQQSKLSGLQETLTQPILRITRIKQIQQQTVRLIKIKITPLIIPATILPTQATTPMYLQRMSHY